MVETGYNDQWGNYVSINVQGWNDTYCHLSRIDVVKGQVIGENMQPTAKQVGDVYRFMTDNEISQKDLDFYITAPRTIYDLIYALGPTTQSKVKEANNGGAAYVPAPQLFIKK